MKQNVIGVKWSSWGECGKEFLEAPTGGWKIVESFIDGVKLRGLLSKVN